jgi:hypothetical protein
MGSTFNTPDCWAHYGIFYYRKRKRNAGSLLLKKHVELKKKYNIIIIYNGTDNGTDNGTNNVIYINIE